jgi:hypothetical protein
LQIRFGTKTSGVAINDISVLKMASVMSAFRIP